MLRGLALQYGEVGGFEGMKMNFYIGLIYFLHGGLSVRLLILFLTDNYSVHTTICVIGLAFISYLIIKI